LRGVHTNREASRPGGYIISKQCPLPSLIEFAFRIQSKRTRRNNQPVVKGLVNLRADFH
jgi:hypothetical protein